MRRYLRDPTFSRFDTIPECDGHTHTHTDGQTDTRRRHILHLPRRRAVKIKKNHHISATVCVEWVKFGMVMYPGVPDSKDL